MRKSMYRVGVGCCLVASISILCLGVTVSTAYAISELTSVADADSSLAGGTMAAYGATVVTDCVGVGFCTTSTGPCDVNGTVEVVAGSIVDCSGRDVTVGAGDTVKVFDGFFTLKANDLVVASGQTIKAIATDSEIFIGFDIDLTGSASIPGALRAANTGGGSRITLSASGDITFPEDGTDGIDVAGDGADSCGGEARLASEGGIFLYDPIRADGAGAGFNNGGTISLSAGREIVTGLHGKLLAVGRAEQGGTITLSTTGKDPLGSGDIEIGAQIDAYGKLDSSDGGVVEIGAIGAVIINSPVCVRGGVNVMGAHSSGGTIALKAGCGGVQVNADLDARGGESGGVAGGSLEIDSVGDVTIAAAVQILSAATQTDGEGGDISIETESALVLHSGVVIDASGDTAGEDGTGATVELVACSLELESGVSITAGGFNGGEVLVYAAGIPQTPPLPIGTKQPLVIHDTTDINVATGATEPGFVELTAAELMPGVCSNDETIRCTLDADCTVGCTTGDCLQANPDTDGVAAQFDVELDAVEHVGLRSCGAGCE